MPDGDEQREAAFSGVNREMVMGAENAEALR